MHITVRVGRTKQMVRTSATLALILLGCGGVPARDQARTAAELSRDRPASLSDELPEATREGLRMDLHTLNAQIDRALASEESAPVLDLLGWAAALELSEPHCELECERRLLFLYDGLALMHASHFAFSTAAPTEANAMYDRMLARSPALARWAMGRVLTATSDPATVGRVLERLAGRERDDGHLERARYYLEWALATAPSAAAHAALGSICYRLGDLSCGDTELSALDGSAEAESIARLRDAARVAQAPATGIEAQLARAEAMAVLHRDMDAIALLEQLAEEYPDDARPLVARAQMVFLELANLRDPVAGGLRAAPYLERAAHLSHREARYYELATLVWARRVLSEGSPARHAKLASQLKEIVTGFRKVDPATAGAVDLYGRTTLGWIGVDGVTAPTLADGLALRARHPDNVHLFRVSLLLAAAGVGRPSAEVFVGFDQERDTTTLVRVAVALQWDDPTLLGETPAGGELGAIVLALRAHHGLAAWPEVAEAYRTLAERADPASADRLRNGLAVALWEAGDHAGARALLEQLAGPAAELNSLATLDADERDATWRERLEVLRAGDDPGIACGAARLLRMAGASSDADAHAACARPGTGLPERDGTISSGSTFQFEFGLSSRIGFRSRLEVQLEPWQLIAP
jgi:tetratricopeptide (TPR) repeat protein